MTAHRVATFLRRTFGFARREDGTASLEFVLMLPAFTAIFLASFESGLLMTRSIMLERALDLTVRDLRLGLVVNPTHDSIKKAICDRTVMFDDCEQIMMLELRPVSQTTWAPLGTSATCIDRSAAIQLPTDFSTGLQNEMMLVRACAVFDPIFPLTGLGLSLPKDATGGYDLVASSAFVNEPS